ncbi:MAG: hypothetical protein E5Y79_21110 [Mesorhizobium sp.]|nr:MAG: hypothetical protein EOS13_20345 [Mesorhizobium sp.]TIL35081.1 MAG: hypothetical protein E5Y85_08290 [Mesorhizobium sp.]TIL46914.1 MAG: hypothetical protein E5Y86_04035 [Mesorhizobium sp.]TIL52727.1 MAG: hypothetical protein E5Y83_10770 [Mesorhizobium sp.]TIL58143.1 MAG: hypothetical protein E5Y79_21110 [Mesorhizobium sp.]
MKGDCIARLLGSSRQSRLGHGAATSNHIGAKALGEAIGCRCRRRPSSACRHLLPVKNGEKGPSRNAGTPSPRPSRGEGEGEGQRQPEAIAPRNERSGLAYDIHARHVRPLPAALLLH